MKTYFFCSLLVLLGILALSVEAGSFFYGERRYFPTGWTEPEVNHHTSDTTGRTTMSYKPSVPTDFKEYDLGHAGSVDVHLSTRKRYDIVRAASVRLRLNTGHIVEVRQGQEFDAGGHTFKLLTVWSDAIRVKNVDTGRIFTKVRKNR